MRRYIEQVTHPDGTVTETPVNGIILMDTYKAQRSADKTYLAAFGLEDDPQSETIL